MSNAHDYPHDTESVRPFRLWDTKNKRQMPWRYYVHKENAHIGALIEARWAKVGTTIEVIDIRKQHKLVGQYTRKPHTVAFT